MLNGDGNENGVKINRSNQQKNKLHVQHTFFSNKQKTDLHMQHTFCLSLPLSSPTTTLFCRTKTSNFLVTCFYYGGIIVVCAYPIFCLLCSFSLLFFTAAHFHLAGRLLLAGHQHLSLSHCHFEFSCFLPTKFASFVFNHSLQLFLCYPHECKHKKQHRKRHNFSLFFLSKVQAHRAMRFLSK